MSALATRLQEIVAGQKAKNRYRKLEPLASAQGRLVKLNDRDVLNFCSNDYLGLSSHPALADAAADAARRFGIGSGGSALLAGRSTVHEELERRLATFLNRDRVLLYSSGYLANLGVIGALVKRHDHVYHDRLNHASLIDAVMASRATNTRYAHVDTKMLAAKLARDSNSTRWIITDTLFSMDGDIAPLEELARIAEMYSAVLMGDDAHGIGVIGNGRGAAEAAGLTQAELPIHVVTFGKALGTAGAAVAGSEELIEALIQQSRTFIYDTAPPPAICAATIAAIDIISHDSEFVSRLHDNIAYFRELATELPLLPSGTPIQPVVFGDETLTMAVARFANERGLYVRAIRPPTVPAGTSRLRICLSASHTREDIACLVTGLTEAVRELLP